MEYSYSFKYVIVGNTRTGKTSICESFVKKPFNPVHDPTIGVDLFARIISIDTENTNGHVENKNNRDSTTIVKLQIWDCAGMPQFQSVIQTYFKQVCVMLMVFDITDASSFRFLQRRFELFQKECDPETLMVVVGNKIDLEQQRGVSLTDIQLWTTTHHLPYFETSCVTGEGVKQVFHQTAVIVSKSLMAKKISGVQSFQMSLGSASEYEDPDSQTCLVNRKSRSSSSSSSSFFHCANCIIL